MATERQIEANRLNASRSCGPKSESGRARSCLNATKHGMAAESALVEPGLSAEFEARRARWAAEQKPVGEAGEWALDRAVAASLRIEKCERALDELTAASRERARLAWDQDRAVEAAATFGRLAKDPVLASRQLQASLAGVELLLEAWLGLASTLLEGRDWSEVEASRALDLLGVAADLRSGRTLVDGPVGTDPVEYRRELAREEIDRLEALAEEALAPLDEMDRRLAMEGDAALLSKPAKLILRYERDAWRRYRESMAQVRSQGPAPTVAEPAPAPAVEDRPEARERAVAPPSPSLEEERRSLLAEAAPIRAEVIDGLRAMGLDDEDAWIDELERRLDTMPEPRTSSDEFDTGPARRLATERTQFGRTPLAPNPLMRRRALMPNRPYSWFLVWSAGADRLPGRRIEGDGPQERTLRDRLAYRTRSTLAGPLGGLTAFLATSRLRE